MTIELNLKWSSGTVLPYSDGVTYVDIGKSAAQLHSIWHKFAVTETTCNVKNGSDF